MPRRRGDGRRLSPPVAAVSRMARRRGDGQRAGAALLAAVALAAVRPQTAHAAPHGITVTVHAVRRSYHTAPVMVDVAAAGFPAGMTSALLTSTDRKERLVCQISRAHGAVQLAFLLPDLPQGATRTYRLTPTPGAKNLASGVTLLPRGADMDVFIAADRAKRLFTTYTTSSGRTSRFSTPS